MYLLFCLGGEAGREEQGRRCVRRGLRRGGGGDKKEGRSGREGGAGDARLVEEPLPVAVGLVHGVEGGVEVPVDEVGDDDLARAGGGGRRGERGETCGDKIDKMGRGRGARRVVLAGAGLVGAPLHLLNQGGGLLGVPVARGERQPDLPRGERRAVLLRLGGRCARPPGDAGLRRAHACGRSARGEVRGRSPGAAEGSPGEREEVPQPCGRSVHGEVERASLGRAHLPRCPSCSSPSACRALCVPGPACCASLRRHQAKNHRRRPRLRAIQTGPHQRQATQNARAIWTAISAAAARGTECCDMVGLSAVRGPTANFVGVPSPCESHGRKGASEDGQTRYTQRLRRDTFSAGGASDPRTRACRLSEASLRTPVVTSALGTLEAEVAVVRLISDCLCVYDAVRPQRRAPAPVPLPGAEPGAASPLCVQWGRQARPGHADAAGGLHDHLSRTAGASAERGTLARGPAARRAAVLRGRMCP